MKNLVVLSNLKKYHKIIMEEENRTEQARQDAPRRAIRRSFDINVGWQNLANN